MAPADARLSDDWRAEKGVDAVLVEGDAGRVLEVQRIVAGFAGPIVPVMASGDVNTDMLVHEMSVSINTAAAGGNASLMALRED
jgi:RHH-type proline utilization regulon transcriptional repressor/proline dehydrogenase/delta 1-pyrroline-5-carboxylate dehydrogenase